MVLGRMIDMKRYQMPWMQNRKLKMAGAALFREPF